MACYRGLCSLLVALACSSVLPQMRAIAYVGTGTGGRSDDGGNTVVVLGGLFPIHQNEDNRCGHILDLGIQRQEAMVFAVEKVNENPDLLPGITLGFEIRDTCAQANYALEQSLDYVSARTLRVTSDNDTVYGISGVVGAASSSVSIAVANLLRLFRIPQVSYASTARILSDRTRFDYFLRTLPPDLLQAKAMADIVVHFGWSYVVAIHSDDAYGSEGIAAFIDELGKRNGTKRCIATEIELPLVASQEDFERAVDEMNEEWVRNASVVVLFGQLATATGVLGAVNKRRQTDPAFAEKSITWIASDAWGDQFPEEYHSIAQGMLSVIPHSKNSAEFDQYFQSLNPTDNAANPWFREYWEHFFNCTFEGVPDYAPCNPSTQTISPESGYRQNSKVPFAIDAVYAFAHAVHKLRRDHCSDLEGLCPEIVDNPAGATVIRGDLLLEYLHNVSFRGVSADVIEFDENGDQEGGYLIKNLDNSGGGYTFETIGFWDSLKPVSLDIFGQVAWNKQTDTPHSICSLPCRSGEYPEPVRNEADCCWICQPCRSDREISTGNDCVECDAGYIPNGNKTECVVIAPTFLKWSSPWSILILCLTSLGIIATAFIAVVFLIFHKKQLIKASSRELSAVLLVGLMLCYLLPFFFIARPSIFTCAIRRFGVGFCFALCYSALLVKTNRIHRIFSNATGSRATQRPPPLISPQSQLFFTSLLVMVQVIIAAVWLVLEVPGVKHIYGDYSTELKCNESTHIGLSVSLGYNLFLLLLSTYFAFRARKIPQNFNEAKFINLTLYTTCIIWLAFIPTYFATAALGTVYQTSSQILAITLSATTTLCCLFLPKIYFLFSRMCKEHQSNPGSYGSQRQRNNSVSSVNIGMSFFGSEYSRRPSSAAAAFDPTNSYTSVSLLKHRSDSTSSYRSSDSSMSPGPFPRMDIPHRHFELPVLPELEEEIKSTCTTLDGAAQSRTSLSSKRGYNNNSGVNESDDMHAVLLEVDGDIEVFSDHVDEAAEPYSEPRSIQQFQPFSDASTQTSDDTVFVFAYRHFSSPPSMEPIQRSLLYRHIPLPPRSSTPYGSLENFLSIDNAEESHC